MWEVLSLARHTFRESLRKKVLLVIVIVFLVVVVVSTGLAPATYPEARVTLALAVALRSMALFGLLTIVFLAATSIPEDIRERTIYTLLAKPLTRGKVILGRTLGFVLVAVGLLVVMGVISWAFVHYTASRYLEPAERARLLSGRRFLYPQSLQILRGEELLETKPTAEGVRWASGELEVVGRYLFSGVRPAALWAERVSGELEFLTNVQGTGVLPGVLTVTNPTTGASADISLYYRLRQPSTFSFPTDLVDEQGTVVFLVKRTSREDALGLGTQDLRLYLRPTSFAWNLTKMMFSLLLGLAVAAALAVMGSTVLSSMVSICFAFFICFLGNVVEAMRRLAASLSRPGALLWDLTPGLYRMTAEAAPLWLRVLNEVLRDLLTGLSMVVPDFRNFYASPYLVRGHSVPPSFVGWALLYFFIYGGVAFLVGWLLFRRRELA